MKILLFILLLSDILVGCGTEEQGQVTRKKTEDARATQLPSELYLVAAIESFLEVSFLDSTQLKKLEDANTNSIIAYHSEDYFERFDMDGDGQFSKLEIIEAYNNVLSTMSGALESEKAKYLDTKNLLNLRHSSLKLAHKNNDMQLVDSLLGGLFQGSMGNIAGSLFSVLTKVIFPGSETKKTRAQQISKNEAHQTYGALSELKQLILLSSKAITEIEKALECIESSESCPLDNASAYWERGIQAEISSAQILSELGY